MMVGNFDVDVRHQQRLIWTSPTRNAKWYRIYGSNPRLHAWLGCVLTQHLSSYGSSWIGKRQKNVLTFSYLMSVPSKLNRFSWKKDNFLGIFDRFSNFQKSGWYSSGLSFLGKQESRGIDFWALDSRFHGNDTLSAWMQSSIKSLIWTRVI